METPHELCRVEDAVPQFQRFLANSIPRLPVLLARDAATGEQDSETLQNRCGVYVLFYPTGEVARIGEAPKTFDNRLNDYKKVGDKWIRMAANGCLDFRWVAAIPFEASISFFIPSLERYLIRELDPPENKHHRRKVC